mmetsp:Transcript_44522/g.131920  ORF Transcript_44522/g.131920 Transcript_44522/m.131920 type:complete len:438 (+) Transcript_44522:99-1412(+)
MPAVMKEIQALQQSRPRVEDSPTSLLSNTLAIADPNAHWLGLQKDLLRELGNFGQIARLDASMAAILHMVNITFFDVRSAVEANSHLFGRGEHLPPMGDDFRVVLVNLEAFERQLGEACSFSQFGEVASISSTGGGAVVEYYDIRCAMALVASGGGSVSPCSPQRLAQQLALLSRAEALAGSPMAVPREPSLAPPPGLEDHEPYASEPPRMSASAPHFHPEARRSASQSNLPGLKKSISMTSAASEEAKGMNRPIRTKVSSKDFSKYDVEPEKISAGQDLRTTVMVRNLVGQRARKDFLKLLEGRGLADRYTFFYMPCKEHRDTPAGFAFVNLTSAMDVLTLHSAVETDVWRTQIRDMQVKPLALSYARFQGHEELMAHFSSSVVLSEQDPDRRPLFCNPNKKAHAYSPTLQTSTSYADDKHSETSEVSAGAPWIGA